MHLAFFFQQYQVYLSERMSLKKDHNIDAKKFYLSFILFI